MRRAIFTRQRRVTAFLVMLLGTACTAPLPPSPTPVPTPVPTATVAPTRYPADVVQNFMNACQRSGGTQAICGCVLDHVQTRYTVQEFSRLEVQLASGQQMPQDLLNILADCRVSAR